MPLRALVWQDEAHATWVTYVDPLWLAGRYGIPGETLKIAEQMVARLAAVAQEATT